MTRLLGLDLESTGADPHHDRIVELCLILHDTDTDAEKLCYQRLINPMIHISKGASDVHGIVDADVMGAPKFDAVAPLLVKIIEKSDCIIAHNGEEFDMIMLLNELLRVKTTVTKFPPIFDTMKQGRWATPDGKYPTLGELCWSLGVDYDTTLAHGAEYDVRVMLEAFRKAVKLGYWEYPS